MENKNMNRTNNENIGGRNNMTANELMEYSRLLMNGINILAGEVEKLPGCAYTRDAKDIATDVKNTGKKLYSQLQYFVNGNTNAKSFCDCDENCCTDCGNDDNEDDLYDEDMDNMYHAILKVVRKAIGSDEPISLKICITEDDE